MKADAGELAAGLAPGAVLALAGLGVGTLLAFTLEPIEREALAAMLAPRAALLLLAWVGLNRLANLGMNRMWGLAFFAPILNLWVGYRCFACPAGFAHHKKQDFRGIALAVVYWLVMLSAILLAAAFVTTSPKFAESSILNQVRGLLGLMTAIGR